MTLVRRLARPLLASYFVADGIDALRDPAPREPVLRPVADQLAQLSPSIPNNARSLVKAGAVAQVLAGLSLALGRAPRLSALALAVALLPRAYAESPASKANDQVESPADPTVQTLKNAGLLGGLLLAAVDTEGNPSLAWRARHARRNTRHAVRSTRRQARLAARLAKARMQEALPG